MDLVDLRKEIERKMVAGYVLYVAIMFASLIFPFAVLKRVKPLAAKL
jgi:hypothetical protein